VQSSDENSASRVPITVIMNAGSGHDDAQASHQSIEQAFAEAGREAELLLARSPDEIQRLAQQTVAHGRHNPRVVVAAGGDGTINAVAGAVMGSDLPFGVIPLGTFNYFARDLGIPLEPAAAARAIAEGWVKRANVATVNGHVFLNNASIGLYRRLLEQREAHKRLFGRYRFVAMLSGLITLLRHHRTYEVRLELDGEPRTVRTPMLFFGNNTLQLEQLDLDVARCTEHGELALLVLRPMARLELMGFALRGALQGLRQAENLRCYCASRIDVHWRAARRVKVAIDGELIECRLPLRFEVARGALKVVVPRDPAPRE
jgi:diacylglycerol kinase family enzyme